MSAVVPPAAPARRAASRPIGCPHCGAPLGATHLVSGPQICPACGGRFEAQRFDPPPPDARVPRVSPLAPEGSFACAVHGGNEAVGHCERCGLIVCALCRVPIEDQSLCPACFERLAGQAEHPALRHVWRDDLRVAGGIALLGWLFTVFSAGLILGPTTLYFAVRGWRRRRAAGEETGGGTLLAVALLALGQVAASAGWLWALLRSK
jgi:hypothetical protein